MFCIVACMASRILAVGVPTARIAEVIQPARLIETGLRRRTVTGAGRDNFGGAVGDGRPNTTRSSSEFEPRPIGAMDRDAGRFARRHQAGHDRVGISPSS